ncbi:MAG: DUF4350 domain-containing protein [Gemmatimonadaceae bacterium]|nr:DUF4350 domain-containing protein [Gemmatimonadaceae bacterium]
MSPTTPPRGARRPTPWWARPGVMLPLVAGLAFATALFTPIQGDPRGGDPRLSSLSTGPLGARLLHDLLQRLGWRTERRLRQGLPTDAPDAIVAVLDPRVPLRATEVHAILTHVRAGGAAVLVAGAGTGALLDSLHVTVGDAGRAVPVAAARYCAKESILSYRPLWFGTPIMRVLRFTAPTAGEVTRFLEATVERAGKDSVVQPVLVGMPLGAGRVVLAVDGDVFRNDAMRDCAPAFDVAAVRAFEYARDGGPRPRTLVVFDEYHQGHGARPGTIRAVLLYLGTSPSGRLLAQLALAGVLLLLALAPRLVPPPPDGRLERRSPLEQVDALARAYDQVRATRTAAERLVRGLRRRTERGPVRDRRALSDDAWLARLAERHPVLAEPIDLARQALAAELTPRQFATLGPALHRIETTLTRSPS